MWGGFQEWTENIENDTFSVRIKLKERGRKLRLLGELKRNQKGTDGHEGHSAWRPKMPLGVPLSVLFPGWVKVWLLMRSMVHFRGRRPGVFWRLGSCWPGVIRPGRLRGIGSRGLRRPDSRFRQVSPGTTGAWRWRVLKERGCPWPGITRDWGALRQRWGALLLSSLCG